MSMVFRPARFRIPGIEPSEMLQGDGHRDGVWIDAGAGLAAFNCELNGNFTDLLVDLNENPTPKVGMDGGFTLPSDDMYAGRPVYGFSGWTIYWSALEGGWILVQGGQTREPRAWKPDGGDWQGDGWYLLGGLDPAAPGCYVSVQARGTFEDNPTLDHVPVVEVKWPRWCRDDGSSVYPCGIWRAQDDAIPTVQTIGLIRFVDGDGNEWAEQDDGSLTGAGIVLSARSGGVLASEGYRSAATWYQCASMPGREGGTVGLYHLDPMSGIAVPVEGEPQIVLTYTGYGLSGTPKEIMLAEVALWR